MPPSLGAPPNSTNFASTYHGAGMHIHNFGHAILPTPSSRSLALKHVLYVPDATRNLLSMSKLSRDNNVFIDLHPHDLLVKD